MSQPCETLGDLQIDLPPLILHPFNERMPPSTLLDNSKAALILSGFIPGDGSDREALEKRLLSGRYAEIRMLFFLGKDVFRWMDQCLDASRRFADLAAQNVRLQTFAGLLTGDTPSSVKEKLKIWGVADYGSIFSRAIGINTLFAEPPSFERLSEEFLRNYHRYADSLYRCFMEMEPYLVAASRNFQFDLFASGEYSRLLESTWDAD